MSLITIILSLLTTDIWTTFFTALIAFIVYKLTKFYVKAFSLPPGPIPIPFLGNVTYFKGTKEHWAIELERVAKKYGPVMTMWMGTFPLVLISDIDLARETFRKNEFSGRPKTIIAQLLTLGKSTDIVFADYGHHWEALRRVAHSAVQKYSTTDKLVYLVSDCVDHTIKTIVEKEGLNKPFAPNDYIYNNFLNILAASAFGQRYEINDPEYKTIKYMQKDFFSELNQKFVFWEMFPILRKVYRKDFRKLSEIFGENFQLLRNKFKSHYKDYDESIVRDFCDTLISAKNDALREGKESAPYLTDDNLTFAIFDLFFAGTDTTQNTFVWIVFFMTYYPNILKKLRTEIESEVGDRIPTHEDRERCHYVMAVISETLRMKNVVPIGVNHTAVVRNKIGNNTIPKGQRIAVFQSHILNKEEYWPNAQEFRPERFLENEKYVTTRPKAYIPFGVGRRVCLGEKLAMADLFLSVVRFIQKTSEYDLVLHYSGDTKADPNKATEINPKYFQISFNTKM